MTTINSEPAKELTAMEVARVLGADPNYAKHPTGSQF
jgi:hypothetical protein